MTKKNHCEGRKPLAERMAGRYIFKQLVRIWIRNLKAEQLQAETEHFLQLAMQDLL